MKRTEEEPDTLPEKAHADPVVLIFVRGGLVQSVEATQAKLSYRLIDLDSEDGSVWNEQDGPADVEAGGHASQLADKPTASDQWQRPAREILSPDGGACWQPTLTPEARHMIWELSYGWGVSATVALNTAVRWAYAEEGRRREAEVRGVQTVELDARLYRQVFGRCMETGISPSTLIRAIVEAYLRDCSAMGQQTGQPTSTRG